MKYRFYLLITILVGMFSLMITACFDSNNSNAGVAQTSEITSVVSDDEIASAKDTEITDEQRATQYVECLRDLGYSMKDPELKADGTIDALAFRMAISQVLSSSGTEVASSKDRKSHESCRPLLDGITWKKRNAPEDETKLKDDVLKFAQCLRDKGFDVKDPVFGDNPRASMRPMIQNLTGPTAKVDSSVEECNSLIFDTKGSGRGR